jgi:serine/threonine protein kinase
VNIVDQRVYAIKKIKLKPNFKESILEEVKTLSRLYHPNVVRYFNSWIEDDEEAEKEKEEAEYADFF